MISGFQKPVHRKVPPTTISIILPLSDANDLLILWLQICELTESFLQHLFKKRFIYGIHVTNGGVAKTVLKIPSSKFIFYFIVRYEKMPFLSCFLARCPVNII